MSEAATTFHLFPDLPPELREEIWKYCLPHRVCELDYPSASATFRLCRNHESYVPTLDAQFKPMPPIAHDIVEIPPICELQHSTRLNGLPPVVSRVCHESRAVALKAGKVAVFFEEDRQAAESLNSDSSIGTRWETPRRIHRAWQDRSRDSIHVNARSWWEKFDRETETFPGAWRSLSSMAPKFAGTPSFTILPINAKFHWLLATSRMPPLDSGYISPLAAQGISDLAGLRSQPAWQVVMRTVIIHCDLDTARETGLFGLLGDAYVQIVDAYNLAKTAALIDFAKRCEADFEVTVHQDFATVDPDEMKEHLDKSLTAKYNDKCLGEKMRPAVMFRLCPLMCNRRSSNTTESHESFIEWGL